MNDIRSIQNRIREIQAELQADPAKARAIIQDTDAHHAWLKEREQQGAISPNVVPLRRRIKSSEAEL